MSKYILIILILSSLSFNKEIQSMIRGSENSTQSEEIYRKAKTLDRKGLINESEELLIQIFNDFPSNDKYFNAIKKILLKREDCLGLMNYTEKYSRAKKNDIYSKIQQLESSIICNAEWEDSFNKLLSENIDNSRFMKKLVSMLLKNNEEPLAISTIDEKRKIENNSFFALELGYYYLSLKDYETSLIEYLNHLEKFPKQLEMINQRIISFSDDISINNNLILILEKSSSKESKIILSDLYFKINMLEESIKILKEGGLYNELFSMAINLDIIKEHNMTQNLLLYIINNSTEQKIVQKSIYELAKVLEKRSAINKLELPISNFMNGNSYFNSPFIKTDVKDSIYLYRAKRMYDSLNIKGNNLQSRFRTTEIDFRIFQYLDESLNNYKQINDVTNDKDLKLKTINRVVDVLVAKGNLDEALNFINTEISQYIWNKDEKINLQIKLNQILFYQSELNLVFENLNLILKEFSSQEDSYNDILSILSVVLLLKDEDEYVSNKYIKAQLKINQNKRVESIGILNSILEGCNNNKISCKNNLTLALIKYQISNLLISQNKPNDAIIVLESINGDSIYTELASIFLAEIYDYIKEDKNTATRYYLLILQEYPQSIYYEIIRKRLRTILEKT